MRDALNTVASVMIGLAGLGVGVAFVHREFFPPPPPAYGPPKPEFVADWRSMVPAGRRVGPTDAPVTIVEFTDLQCPFCRRFNSALRAARQRYPNELSVVAVHFPIRGHQYAHAAARAVECAAIGGKAFPVIDTIFGAQDSLGRKPWSWFAKGAGVVDTISFARCMADTTTRPLVAAGLEMGKKFEVIGTPTVLLNGWKYAVPPSDTELVRAIGDIIAKRKPYKDFPASALTPVQAPR